MNKCKIKEMADHEKPVEKLLERGPEVLSDAELLAIILRTGSNEMSAIELAQFVLNAHPIYKGLSGLNYRYVNDLVSIPGIGYVKASQIIAITEISRRISSEKHKLDLSLSSSDSVANYFMEEVRYMTKERVYALFNTSSHRIIKKVQLSEGSIDRSILSIRELFKEALRADAANIVLIHNHPSGDPSPSTIDVSITRQIKNMGDEMGIPLLDHIIIGNGTYYSMGAEGLI